MGRDAIKTWGAGKAQVFETELELPAEQERLNRLLKHKAPGSPRSHSERGRVQEATSQATTVVLVISSTPRPSELNVWDLATTEGETSIPLSVEIAGRCYGKPEQAVTIRLHRVEGGGSPDLYEPQIEVSPSPTQGSLTLLLPFPDGSQRELTVPVPHGDGSSAWSRGCEPLPATAFSADRWEGNVKLRALERDE